MPVCRYPVNQSGGGNHADPGLSESSQQTSEYGADLSDLSDLDHGMGTGVIIELFECFRKLIFGDLSVEFAQDGAETLLLSVTTS